MILEIFVYLCNLKYRHQQKFNLCWCFLSMFKKCFIINKKSKKATKNDFYMIKINKEILSMEGLKWIYI